MGNNVIKAKGRPMLHWEGKTASLNIEYYPAQEKEVYGDKESLDFNKIFWGDNFQVLSHLLKDYKGKIDLIYIDPPFDSKADYVKKIKFRGKDLQAQEQSIFEEKQYGDIWGKDEYLQFMYERLLLLRELLSDTGSIYLHCDWHKSHHLRCLMDEVFGSEQFQAEIIWSYTWGMRTESVWNKKHDNILMYSKTSQIIFNSNDVLEERKMSESTKKRLEYKGAMIKDHNKRKEEKALPSDVWYVATINGMATEKTDYPTQKPEELLERIIKASSNPGDLVLDCFMGSGTTCAVAQKLSRKWIGCDINTGAIQTTTKRLNKIIEEQNKTKNILSLQENEKQTTPNAFKIYNVNEYNVFKNKDEGVEAYKTILLEAYGVESVRGFFDGKTSSSLVKIIDPNRLLSKKDIDEVLKNIDDTNDIFILNKSPLKYYEIEIICSGKELDIDSYIKKTNNTQIKINVRDILIEKEGLIFKEKPEIEYDYKVEGKKLTINIIDFISPVLLKKLDIDNKKGTDKDKTIIEDFKQIIDSIAIDIDFDGNLFNAEIIDNPSKKELIKGSYEWEYKETGKQTIAVKIIDILGEDLFITFDIDIK